MDKVFIALHQAGLKSQDGISGMARRTGKKEKTVLAKLNPDDDFHQPTIGEFVLFVNDTGDVTPVEELCAVFGGRFVTKTQERASSLLTALLNVVKEHGDISAAVDKALEDNVIDDKEEIEINRQIEELRHALTVYQNTIKAHREGEA